MWKNKNARLQICCKPFAKMVGANDNLCAAETFNFPVKLAISAVKCIWTISLWCPLNLKPVAKRTCDRTPFADSKKIPEKSAPKEFKKC